MSDQHRAALRKIIEKALKCYEFVSVSDNEEKCKTALFYLIGQIEGICDMIEEIEDLEMEAKVWVPVPQHPK